jgi:hypothetical protein
MPSAAVGKFLNFNYVKGPTELVQGAADVFHPPAPKVPATPPVPPAANPASLANSSSASSASNVGAKAAAALAAQNGGAQFGGSATSKASLLGPS